MFSLSKDTRVSVYGAATGNVKAQMHGENINKASLAMPFYRHIKLTKYDVMWRCCPHTSKYCINTHPTMASDAKNSSKNWDAYYITLLYVNPVEPPNQ